MPVRAVPRLVGRSCAEQSGHVWVRKPRRNLPVASKTSVLAAEKPDMYWSAPARALVAREPQRFQIRRVGPWISNHFESFAPRRARRPQAADPSRPAEIFVQSEPSRL